MRAWWERCPNANIGVALCFDGFDAFAIDIDPRNGGDLGELVRKLGPLPQTVQALTGGGGNHVLLMGRVASSVLAPGIDIKGAGGYIVLPPSIHPSGQLYRWEASSRPNQVSIAAAPNELLRALAPPRRSKAAPTRNPLVATRFGLGAAFLSMGTLGPEIKPGVWAALCPTACSTRAAATSIAAPSYWRPGVPAVAASSSAFTLTVGISGDPSAGRAQSLARAGAGRRPARRAMRTSTAHGFRRC